MHGNAHPGFRSDGPPPAGAHLPQFAVIARTLLAHQAPLLVASLAAVILVIDDVFFRYPLPLRVATPLDEVGHAATMILALCVLAGRVPSAFVAGSMIGAIMLDLDHLSIVFNLHAWAQMHGRPYSHSLVTVAAVALLTGLPRRWRMVCLGMVCGLLSHLSRDLATGVVPLFWPLTTVQLSIPHALYTAAILAALVWVLTREPVLMLLDSKAARRWRSIRGPAA